MISSLFLRQSRSKPSFLLSRPFHSTCQALLAVNALEESLELAAKDPKHRPQFYRDLLSANIFVIPAPTPQGGDSKGLYLQQWQIPIQGSNTSQAVLPFFSSLENLQEFQFDLPEQEPHAELKCRSFLELVSKSHAGKNNHTNTTTVVVLNPGMQYGKAFSWTEISGLLDGSLLAPEMSDISQGHDVFLGVPRVYPTELVNALSHLFQDFDAVEAAYLAHVFIPESGEPPHSCIGLKLSQPEALPVILEFAVNLQKQVAPDKLVDFVQVEEDSEDDVVKYLLKTEPFYKGE